MTALSDVPRRNHLHYPSLAWGSDPLSLEPLEWLSASHTTDREFWQVIEEKSLWLSRAFLVFKQIDITWVARVLERNRKGVPSFLHRLSFHDWEIAIIKDRVRCALMWRPITHHNVTGLLLSQGRENNIFCFAVNITDAILNWCNHEIRTLLLFLFTFESYTVLWLIFPCLSYLWVRQDAT